MDDEPKTVGDDPTFVSLVAAAQQDPEMRARLRAILELDSVQRKALLHSLLKSMSLQAAPEHIAAAIAHFMDDAVAKRTLELLDEAE